MIRIGRRSLRELARAFVLANTPFSLCRALLDLEIVHQLATEDPVDLLRYYDHLTARPRRTEFELGLAYAVLIALLKSDRPHGPVDSSRLKWGPAIEDFLQRLGRATQTVIIHQAAPPPTMSRDDSQPGAGLYISGAANRLPRG